MSHMYKLCRAWGTLQLLKGSMASQAVSSKLSSYSREIVQFQISVFQGNMQKKLLTLPVLHPLQQLQLTLNHSLDVGFRNESSEQFGHQRIICQNQSSRKPQTLSKASRGLWVPSNSGYSIVLYIFENIKTDTSNIYKTFHPTVWKDDISFQRNQTRPFQRVRQHLWELTVLFQ